MYASSNLPIIQFTYMCVIINGIGLDGFTLALLAKNTKK